MSVEPLNNKSVSVPVLLAQIAARDDLDAIVAVVRVDGRWRTAWTSGIDLGGLSMAAIKLHADVAQEMHRTEADPRPGLSGPEKESA
jgi:hypothetical protein